ncbi:hypothetical protein [Streptomyces sp. PH10-H1]|nr:hypothetical protein [Streptomyces sp. PH10-H1]MDJ0344054.1 hypothetical protein [Streptomyces sp. PH10-H1]
MARTRRDRPGPVTTALHRATDALSRAVGRQPWLAVLCGLIALAIVYLALGNTTGLIITLACIGVAAAAAAVVTHHR